MRLKSKVKSTFLRGNLIYDQDEVVGEDKGQYSARPY